MRGHAVGHRLDQRRAFAGARTIDGLLGGAVDGEDVVAVDAHAGHAVGVGLDRHRLAARLLARRHRDRPAVVLADEHDRRLVDGGEVEAGVEVVAAGAAVAAERHEHGVVAADARRHASAGGLRQLRADRRADRDEVRLPEAVVHRHLAALAGVAGVAEPLADDLLDRHLPQQQDARLAVGREQPVAVLQRVGGAEVRGLLPGRLQVEADAALALQRQSALVERARRDHQPVELLQLRGGQVRVLALLGLAVLVEDRQQFEAHADSGFGEAVAARAASSSRRWRIMPAR